MFQGHHGSSVLSYQFEPSHASSEREPDEREPLATISGSGIAGDPITVQLEFHSARGEPRRAKAVIPYPEWVRGLRFLYWADLVPIAALDVIAGAPPDLFESPAVLAAKYAGGVSVKLNTRRTELALPAEVLAALIAEVRDEVAQALHVGYLLGQAANRARPSEPAPAPEGSVLHVAR